MGSRKRFHGKWGPKRTFRDNEILCILTRAVVQHDLKTDSWVMKLEVSLTGRKFLCLDMVWEFHSGVSKIPLRIEDGEWHVPITPTIV